MAVHFEMLNQSKSRYSNLKGLYLYYIRIFGTWGFILSRLGCVVVSLTTIIYGIL